MYQQAASRLLRAVDGSAASILGGLIVDVRLRLRRHSSPALLSLSGCPSQVPAFSLDRCFPFTNPPETVQMQIMQTAVSLLHLAAARADSLSA